MSAVTDHLRAHREESLSQLMEYLRIPTVSTQGTGVQETAEHLAGRMENAGIETRIMPTEGFPAVCGEARGPSGAPTLLIYGHYDVQPADLSDGWSSPPFEPEIRDGRIYARGAADNKGQNFAQVKAVEAYRATNTPLPVTVKFLIEGEEEMGSPNLRAFVLAHRELLSADIACSSDGSLHPSDRPTIALGCRGLLYLELRCRGAGKDLHSGSYGGAVESPFWRLMEAIRALRGAEGRIRVPGFYEAIRPLGEADRKALEGIPNPESELRAVLGEGAPQGREAEAFYRRTLVEPNLNICGFMGGYTREGVKTVIPGACRAKLDYRLVVDQEPDRVLEQTRGFLRDEGFGDVEVHKLASFDPSKTAADHPMVQKIISAVSGSGGPAVVYPNFGGSVPDALFTRDLGIPSIWFPLANADSNSHAPDENLRVDLFHRGCALAAAVIEGLA